MQNSSMAFPQWVLMKLGISFIFIKLYQECWLLCEFVFAIRRKVRSSKYWHKPKKSQTFSTSSLPCANNSAENLWTLLCLKLTLEFATRICNMNFEIIHIFPNMTRNEKLKMCKKWGFFFWFVGFYRCSQCYQLSS